MTTPNPNPNNGPGAELEGWLGTGAFEIGGGAWNYGQDFTEAAVREMFELPAITIFNALDLLEEQLLKMPLEALKIFEPLIPDVIEDDFADVASAVAKIIDTLTDGPAALLRGEFDEWLQDTFGALATEVHQVLEILAGLAVTPINSTVQAVKDWWTQMTSGLGNAVTDLTKHINNTVNKFLGLTGTGHTAEDAAAAMGTIYNQVRTSAQQLQDLMAEQTGAAHSGKSYVVSFSNMPNGPFPSEFDLTYSGTGTGYIAIQDGKAVWVKVADGDREVMGKYNDGDTLTDYQNISGTVANPMDNGAKNWVFGRCNAAKTSYVYAVGTRNSLLDFRAELGCVVGGVKYVFATNVPANPNFNLGVKIGTGKGLRNFQVISGNEVIIDYTDTAGISQVGANYRGWGFISSTSNGGNNVPAQAVLLTCSDADPSNATGSGAKISRLNVANSGVSAGRHLFPANFYDSTDLATPDIIVDRTNGKFTASLAGWYRCEIGFRVNPNAFLSAWNCAPAIFKNGTVHRVGTDAYCFFYFGIGAGARYAQTSFSVYLDAGDYVQAGYDAGQAHGSLITGEAAGVETYFSISLLNRSLG
ncbi:structural protein [Mycobacterium phage Microwolf]|uniref:Minor tail protein n=15 Tax=Microwolfvirus microwolf TaxID=1034140 RepID=A0A345L1E1_9CAUD|nr:minor tail protein [Mycobacterium phage Microwolf]AIM51173.1 minor tail protein [Mycobacterium phage Farber]ALA11662.1 minor tail protein [Mycobacterium phage DaHudson]AMS01646.1 minor tail protein [Mycobacterium phage Malinsilva]ANU79277.1 minor tail protein [Mycobacterium phage Aglet]AOY12132.1 minor tail protein [Mycobacterium phage Watson]ASR86223.1 minor tail protein [Mycobacterium phage Stagni]ASW31592.1 minor tail protein [Mycobacterium phage StepMih]AVP41983.1 minor tail protein 